MKDNLITSVTSVTQQDETEPVVTTDASSKTPAVV